MFSLKHTLSLACMICIAACSVNSRPTQNTLNSNGLAPPIRVEQLIRQKAQDAKVPGVAVAYIQNNELQWISTYGKANEKSPVTKDSLFNVASLTKPVFGMLTLKLVQDGKLSLDASLSNYWVDPDVKDDPSHKQLTARLALSHQTGFTNWRGDKPLSFMFEPGSRHEYSGEGFEYLLKAIENKTKQTMPQLMQSYITNPLEMSDTYFGWKTDKDTEIAARYDETAEEIAHRGFYKVGYSAACCTLTTIEDYSTFIEWVAGGAGLTQSLIDELESSQAQHDNPMEHFGLGWRLIQLPESTYLMHDGREPGVRTFATVSPDTGEGVVIFTNSSNGELLYRAIVKMTLINQKEYLAQTDRDTWLYLSSVPKEVQPRMLQFIAQSPSFTSKALYAANEVVFSSSNEDEEITKSLRDESEKHIEQYVQSMVNGKVDGQPFISIMESLLHSDKNSPSKNNSHTSKVEIEKWVNLLRSSFENTL